MLQHGAYTLLLDACYDREQFPTMHDAIEWTWASYAEEIAAIEFVLSRFFTLEDGVYVQKRIQEEIEIWNSRGWLPSDPRKKNARLAIDEWKALRLKIFDRDDYTCIYCGQRGGKLECDHIHPVSRGGSNDESNLATSCKKCNREKGTKTLDEWRSS